MEQQLHKPSKKQGKGTDRQHRPPTKPEKPFGMTPKEGADDDNPAM